MSSHHFVKEDQEPALAILHANAIPFEKTQELLEWSPTVIVTEHSLPAVLQWKIKIDVVFASPAEVENIQQQLADQSPIRVIPYNADSELLSALFHFLSDARYKAVNILIRNETDFDRISQFSNIHFEAFYENTRWAWIKSAPYERWLPAGTQLQFFPESTVATLKTSALNPDYTTLTDGKVHIENNQPFWLGEKLSE